MSIKVKANCPRCCAKGLVFSKDRFEALEGAAFICPDCEGKGYITIEYTPFTGRQETPEVIRVFSSSTQHSVYGHDKIIGGTTYLFSKAGTTYQEWQAGATPDSFHDPVEEQIKCPYYKLFKCSRCDEGQQDATGMTARSCKFFGDRAKCWEEYYQQKNK